jgi:hypothetical protein
MTIEVEIIPSHLRNGFSKGFLDAAKHFTQTIKPTKVFNENVVLYTECLRNVNWMRNRPGDKFELAFMWALLHHSRIPADKIESHIYFLKETKTAEVDFLIKSEPQYGLLLKTSIRERWTQWDHTAYVASESKDEIIRDTKLYGIHHNEHYNSKEHPDWQPSNGGKQKNIEFIKRMNPKFVKLRKGISIYDPEINDLIEDITKRLT